MRNSLPICMLVGAVVLLGVAPALAADIDVSQPVQVTNSTYYERGNSILEDSYGNFWLFWGQSYDYTGNYAGPGNPDNHHYEIFYKTAGSIAALAGAAVQPVGSMPTTADRIYQGQTSCVEYGGDVWVFAVDRGDGGGQVKAWTIPVTGGTWSVADVLPDAVDPFEGTHLWATVHDSKILLVVNRGGDLDVCSYNGVSWSGLHEAVDHEGMPRLYVDGGNLYLYWCSWGSPAYHILQYSAPSTWTEIAAIAGTPDDDCDPMLTKVGSDYVFIFAPWNGTVQFLKYWTASSLAGFHGLDQTTAKIMTAGSYGTTYWVDMWPATITDGSDVYMFYGSEASGTTSGTGNIQMLALDWTVGNDHYCYIQNAVNAASSGDAISIASGTYPEGLVTITTSLSLIGDTGSRPVITPVEDTDHSTHRGWFQIEGASTVCDIRNLVFNGSGKAIENCIRYQEGPTGTVENCDILNIDYTTYVAFGIVIVDYTAWGGGSPLDISPDFYVKDCIFSSIKRVGISVFGVDRAYIQNCTYTGKGDGDWLDYAVEVGGGGYGVIEDGCEITGCTGLALSDSSTSAGILVTDYYGGPSLAVIDDSDIHDNTMGIAVGYGTTDASTVTVTDSDIYANEYGVSTSSSPGITLTVTGNKIHDNTTVGLENDCDNLVAYSNKFYRNGQNAEDNGSAPNQWNHSSPPGNYWDDYLLNPGHPSGWYEIEGPAGSKDDSPLSIGVTLDPATALLDCGDPITFEVEVDEFALDLMGANYKINYDDTKLTFVTATVGDLLNTGSGQYIFTYFDLGGGVIIINSAHLGTGVDGPGVIAEIAFNAIASTIPGTTPVTFSDAELRNSTNQEIPTTWTGADVTIDCDDPTITVTLDAPPSPWTCYNTTPTVDISATDNYDLDCVKYNIDGGSWVDIACGISGPSYTNNDWPLPGFGTLSEGPHTYYFKATDDAGNESAETSVTFTKDTIKPDAVTDFTSTVGHNRISLAWTNPGTDVDRIYVYRNDWTDYPEYVPTGPGYPTVGSYDFLDPGYVWTTYVDASFDNTSRGIYAYRAVVYDCAGNWADPTAPYESDHDRSTSYYLGDVASNAGSWGPNYDGLVSQFDYNPFSGCYWQSPPVGSCNEADFGPTIEPVRGRFGIPTPDDYIGFEDLMIFAMNYGNVTKTGEPVVAVRLAGSSAAGHAAGFNLALCETADENEWMRVSLVVQGNDAFKGLTAEVEYDHAGLELVSVAPSEALMSGDAPVLFMGDEIDGTVRVDLAALGTDVAIGGNGPVATLTFRRTGSGVATVRVAQAEARDAENSSLMLSFDDSGGIFASGTPKVFALRSNTPNPFSTSTMVHYDIPKTASVALTIYNIRGQVVRTLIREVRTAGSYTESWDARDANGQTVSPGIYFCELRSRDFVATHKMLITR
ncbi:MAG: right-handed parallel beta-helix repeat-containing protein [Candidatus Eisenbacteria sp.]|nr:right-handed parallel beta-helix repeat-containing protein [Candidatus Eisenbacteria bacterium]